MGAAVFSKGKLTLSKIGELFLCVTYIVASFTSLSTIRYLHAEGTEYGLVGLFCLIFVFFISWGCDVFAYLVGSLIGKHKLIPEVSPKKSVEGAVGGIIGSVLVSLLFGWFVTWLTSVTDLADVQANYFLIAIYAAVLSVAAQIGDLIASFIKREYNVKDYSNLLPGHGGIMDRFDSVLAVATPLLIASLLYPPFTYIAVM
jgi:phosphatidate cytidylyltransferase